MRRGSGDQTRQQLIDSAVELFSRQSFTGTTIQDIVDNVGASKGAFYHHFESKDDVLLCVMEAMVESYEQRIADVLRVEVGPTEALSRVIRANVLSIFENRKYHSVLVGELRVLQHVGTSERVAAIQSHEERSKRLVADLLKRGIKEGEFRPLADVRVIAAAILSMPQFVYGWLEPERPIDVDNTVKMFQDFILRGLAF